MWRHSPAQGSHHDDRDPVGTKLSQGGLDSLLSGEGQRKRAAFCFTKERNADLTSLGGKMVFL